MSQACTDIGRSRIQSAFAVRENVSGQMAYPTAEHFIAITNDATINQTPDYEDSLEKLGTRDVTERFKNATPAAQSSFNMYINVQEEIGVKPQGHDALVSLFGSSTLDNPPVFSMAAATASETELGLNSVDALAPLPPCGVIEVGSELIYYEEVADDGLTLLGCVRGYAGSTAAAIADDDAGTYKSLAYMQADCNPSFSFILKTDHFWQASTGTTINEASLSLSNAGAVEFQFSTNQGMEVLMAGTSKMTATVAAGATVIPVDLAKSYTVGAWIWNSSVQDSNGGADVGYKVTAVNEGAGTITLNSPILDAWPVDSLVTGFVPLDAERVGDPVKGDTSKVFIDGIRGKLRTSSISYSNNITYLTDEVGTTHPESYVEDQRTVEMQMNTYFRREDAVRFKEGYEGKFVGVRFVFGSDKVVLHMPKVQQTMPTVTMESPTVSLDITGTALASGKGNNAIYLIIN